MPTLPPSNHPGNDSGSEQRTSESKLPLSGEAVSADAGTMLYLGPKNPVSPHDKSAPTPPLPENHWRYRLDLEIGRGAMGAVYRGRDTMFGRDVAVKFLLEEHRANPELLQRFQEEARITAWMQHPSIVTVFAVGETSAGLPFHAMRLVVGKTLDQELETRFHSTGDDSRLLRVFERVCEAIAYAHSQGVIHRDIKPSNIMVGDYGIVKVMDWGVAKVMAQSPLVEQSVLSTPGGENEPVVDSEVRTHLGRVLGTPAYMSPEQAQGQMDRVDERTDVFSLGGILCAILTGDPPYRGASGQSVFRKAARTELSEAHIRLKESEADPELGSLCQRCLASDPQDRPRDAGVLSRELTECLNRHQRQAERDLVRFFELSPDLFCIAGLDGYFRRVNANFSRILGYSNRELLARPLIQFVHPDDWQSTLAVLADLAEGRQCPHFRNRYRDLTGQYRWFDWTAKPFPEQGIVFAVARDVTDRVEL